MYKLTESAAEDFAGIYDYTFFQFGEVQADRYTGELGAFFDTLVSMPDIGREYSAIADVMQIQFRSHTIFYTVRDTDILIVRILHQQMDFTRHI